MSKVENVDWAPSVLKQGPDPSFHRLGGTWGLDSVPLCAQQVPLAPGQGL